MIRTFLKFNKKLSFLTFAYSAALISGNAHGLYDIPLPIPGQSERSNSQECLDKAKNFFTLMGQYYTGMPAPADLNRLDVLSGGILSTAAFQAISPGSYSAQFYPLSSTYRSASGNFQAQHTLEPELPGLLDASILFDVKIGDMFLNATARSRGCGAASKFQYVRLTASKDINVTTPCVMSAGSEAYLGDSLPSLCADPSKTIQQYIDSTIDGFGNGRVSCKSNATLTPAQFKTELYTKLKPGKTLAELCAAIQ